MFRELVVALLLKQRGQFVPRLNVRWIEPQNTPIRFQRLPPGLLIVPHVVAIQAAEIEIGLEHVWGYRTGLLKRLLRLAIVALLRCQHSEEVVQHRVAGVGAKSLSQFAPRGNEVLLPQQLLNANQRVSRLGEEDAREQKLSRSAP